MEKKWQVYLLECSDYTLYTGITNNLDKRMQTHKQGEGSKYVKRKGFGRLLYTINAENRSDASKIEYKVKKLPRNQKIEFFLNNKNLDFSVVKKN
jgi:putative endonuclease